MQNVIISCPKCGWRPDETCIWVCSVCGTKWNTFDTKAECPTCGKVYSDTICLSSKAGCGEISPHKDWYVENTTLETHNSQSIFSFWKKKKLYPVTENDKQWIEHTLSWLSSKLDPEYFKSLSNISPSKLYCGHDFKKSEEDAEFLFKKIAQIIHLDVSQVKLMYFSEMPGEIPEEELTANSMDQIDTKDSLNKYSRLHPEPDILWVGLGWLEDPDYLVILLAHKLLRHKLLLKLEGRKLENRIIALATVAFGFGIFMGNCYYESFGNVYAEHWYTKRSGYLPQQVVAYAMAWLALCNSEDTSWKDHLNTIMLRYFDESYTYIEQNKDKIKWELN